MNYFKISWRNLWRNKRRTLITVASIFFGVLLSTLMNSLQDGTYSNMIGMMVKLSSGYLQVQDPEYREYKSINYIFFPEEELLQEINNLDKVTVVAKRLESFGLLSSGNNTRGGAVIGIEPAKDIQTSNLTHWLSEGSFLETGDEGILLTANIGKHLQLGVGDTLIILSQGYQGVTAAGKYPVRGILTFNTPQLNNLGVFMDIALAQELFYTGGQLTSLKVMVEDYTYVSQVHKEISRLAGEGLVVVDWTELNPELVQFIESDKAGGVVMIAILYLVIAFGIFGTIIMMIAERRKELAVMLALGMQRYRLAVILFLETIYIGLIGVIAGFMASVPVILLLAGNPVGLPDTLAEAYVQYGFEPYLFFGTAHAVFTNQVITVFIITMLISIYPIVRINKMEVAGSLKS